MSSDFSPDQKRYLEGFVSGLSASRVSRANTPARSEPVGPDAIHIKAQDRVVAAGGKLNDQEKIKREDHPIDAYPRHDKQPEMNQAPPPPENFGGPYAHVTTRANLQLREIEPKNAINVIEGLQDIGLCSRGSGADNIRNVTGTATAGIEPQELLDTRP